MLGRTVTAARAARLAGLSLLVALSGCGSDSTGPGNVDEPAQIAGEWRITWSNMSGVLQSIVITCSGVGEFQISQDGETFSGTQDGAGTLTCSAAGQTLPLEFVDETLDSGTVEGEAVTFRLGTIEGGHSGSVAGSSIIGTATWHMDLGNGAFVILNGNFTAVRI